MTQESDTAGVRLLRLRSRPCTRRPHFLLAGTVLSLPLWGVFLGGAALALAGVRGLLEAEPQAPQLTPGGALPEAVLPATTIPSGPHVPRLMGLDAVSGESGEAAPAPADGAIAHDGALAHGPVVKGETKPPGGFERQVREQVLAQLHELGLMADAAPDAMADAALAEVIAGQRAAGSAAGGPEDQMEGDPQLDALNRVLVEKGGVLLPSWTLELQPELVYSYKGANGLMIVEQNGVRSVRAHEADRDKLETAITARLGLPWRSQAELRVPYLRVSEDASDGVRSTGRSEFGLGDVELALAHQFLREDGWVPDLVGELRWSLPTGEDSFDSDGPALGTGFHGLGGRVTLLKTYDPVVFLGSLGYSESLEDEKKGFDIDPGDSWSANLATILAAGPGVSLRTGFAMKFTDEAEVDGRELAGTDKTEGVLSLGAAVSLSPSILLDVGVGIGVTDDAPDVSTKLALAYRF
jgi:hypothetical protein